MKTLRMAAILVVLATGSVSLSADELRLANGDRLTGTVVGLAAGTLTFKTAHGELQVPWKDVAALKMDAPLLVTTSTEPARLIAIDSAGPGPTLADIVGIAAPPPPLQWNGGASAGLLATGGNTEISSTRIDGELVARTARDRYTATGVLNRAEDGGRDTASNWTAAFAYDRFLTERLFAQASTILTNDRFRDLDLRTAIGAGLGYQVWTGPAVTLSVNGGVGYVHENFETVPDDSYTALREGAKLDVSFAGTRAGAFHHHDGYFGVTGDENLFFRMQNGVRLALTAGFVTTAQIDIDYDRSPAPGRVSTDRSFALTFGYRF